MKISKLKNLIQEKIKTAKVNLQNNFQTERVQMVKLSKLKFDKDFKEMFSQEPEKVAKIAKSIHEHGYDKTQLIITTDNYSIIDGNSRFLASQKEGLEFVPVVVKRFTDKASALRYELHLQTSRRNLDSKSLLLSLKKYDYLKGKGHKDGEKGKTSELLAKELGVSSKTIEKARKILKESPELTEKVANNEISLNAAFKKLSGIKISTKDKTFLDGILYAISQINSGITPKDLYQQVQIPENCDFAKMSENLKSIDFSKLFEES